MQRPGQGLADTKEIVTTADLYRTVFQAAPDAILVIDERGRIQEVNDEAERLFGYSKGDLEGKSVEILVPHSVRERHRGQRKDYAVDPRPRPMGIGRELFALRKDGTQIHVEISLSPLRTPDGLHTVAIARDLTERRRLKDFGTGALTAMEDERRRIARELHDETAQSIAAVVIRLKLLMKKGIGGGEAGELAELRNVLHDTVEGIRRIARGLRPPELEDVGLEAAIRSHVREFHPEGRVEMDFTASEPSLEEGGDLVAYRIVQEALANAVRHSGADRIRMSMGRDESGRFLSIVIEDDGCGFRLDVESDPGAGLGLMGMRERAQLAGGSLEIDSRPGRGTRVRALLPLGKEVSS